MLESIHYTEYNSERLREVASDDAADRLSPYLVSNATVSCEKFETRLTTYLSGLKRFLFFFFITTLSASLYGAYLISLFNAKKRA